MTTATTRKQNLALLLLSDGYTILDEFYDERVEAIGWTVGKDVPTYDDAAPIIAAWSEHLFNMADKAQARLVAELPLAQPAPTFEADGIVITEVPS